MATHTVIFRINDYYTGTCDNVEVICNFLEVKKTRIGGGKYTGYSKANVSSKHISDHPVFYKIISSYENLQEAFMICLKNLKMTNENYSKWYSYLYNNSTCLYFNIICKNVKMDMKFFHCSNINEKLVVYYSDENYNKDDILSNMYDHVVTRTTDDDIVIPIIEVLFDKDAMHDIQNLYSNDTSNVE
jgi:hypothetical protein